MKVLNFGSLNFDRTYEVNSFVEAGQTISSQKYSVFLGGKGLNQSVALSNAGCQIYHIGVRGPDGLEFIRLLEENRVNTDFIFESDIHSGHAVIQLNRYGDNAIIVEAGSNFELTKAHIDTVFEQFSHEQCIVLAQNEISNLSYIMTKAKEDGHTLCLNPSPMEAALLESPLHLVDFFILNETEALSMTSLSDYELSIKKIKELYPNSSVILTLGDKGVLFFDGEKLVKQVAYSTTVVDTTCAGDTFTGYVIGGINRGESIEKSLHRASIASSLCIEIKGAANSIPQLKDVMERERQLHEPNTNTAY